MTEHFLKLYDDEPEERTVARPDRSAADGEPIGDGIGVVGIDRSGRLCRIELVEHALRRLDGRRLGGLIAAAVNRAERRASEGSGT